MTSLRIFIITVIHLAAAFGLTACDTSINYSDFLSRKYGTSEKHAEPTVPGSAPTRRLIRLRDDIEAEGHSSLFKAQYVSIAQIDDHNFLISNYVNLLLFNSHRAEICVLKPSFSISDIGVHRHRSIERIPLNGHTYNPTGVYATITGDIFVANYKGNNVLRGSLNIKDCTVNFFQSYSSQSSLGPENVSVDIGKKIVVSANYDAGTVTAFHIDSGNEAWSTQIPQAHGVAIVGERVFATGLRDRKIYELRLSNGGLLRSVGSLGWNPSKQEFMWPTSIYPTDSDELVIADAQSGFISFLNLGDLSVNRYIGGNGPSDELFNYPYSATPVRNAIAVMQSSRTEIVFLDPDGGRVIERFSFENREWPVKSQEIRPFGYGWVGYVNESGPRLFIRGVPYKLGFGNLHPESNGPILRAPDIGGLFNFGPYLYFLQGQSTDSGLSYFFSSSSTTLISLGQEKGRPDLIMSDRIPVDSWLNEAGEIVSNQGILGQHDFLNKFHRTARVLYGELDKEGWIAPKFIYSTLNFNVAGSKISFEEFIKHLDKVFVSQNARSFKYLYDRCAAECNLSDLRKAAASYYKEISGQAYANLDEYILVGMLSGYSGSNSDQKDYSWIFDDCGRGKYYAGYGTTALETLNLNDYLSAESIDSSLVCFSAIDRRDFALQNITFSWYSEKEIPKRLEIYGLEINGPLANSVLIKSIDVEGATTLGGYLFSIFELERPPSFSKYMIKLIRGGEQDRLILRGIFPETADDFGAKPNDQIQQLVGNISRSINYGIGVSKIPPEFLGSTDLVRNYLLESSSSHCGNAAVLLITSLPRNLSWRYFQLETLDGRVHVVVEVFDGAKHKTLDPTLGTIYECSVSALIDGSCDYRKEWTAGSLNPVFQVYRGPGFFYGARTTADIDDYDGLMELYR